MDIIIKALVNKDTGKWYGYKKQDLFNGELQNINTEDIFRIEGPDIQNGK